MGHSLFKCAKRLKGETQYVNPKQTRDGTGSGWRTNPLGLSLRCNKFFSEIRGAQVPGPAPWQLPVHKGFQLPSVCQLLTVTTTAQWILPQQDENLCHPTLLGGLKVQDASNFLAVSQNFLHKYLQMFIGTFPGDWFFNNNPGFALDWQQGDVSDSSLFQGSAKFQKSVQGLSCTLVRHAHASPACGIRGFHTCTARLDPILIH